jgi:uncharacterized protein YbjT (DUF2867 family)
MSANVLITGASGYLGGSLVAALQKAELPAHGTIFALVRKEEQAVAVKEAGLAPLQFDTSDAAAIEKAVLDNDISVVFWLIDAFQADAQLHFIRALAKLKAATGTEVHFLHVCNHNCACERHALTRGGRHLAPRSSPAMRQPQMTSPGTTTSLMSMTSIRSRRRKPALLPR